ncbi:uncharacterized protein LOC124170302 [Ischnura elegans]|uniref:uncharacterized protein LOC124170302 n=1 Tax=Ischnura elegans TaxID=197161 RepID=UPI001ED8837E|nr:uncharacterized protein LOC124170302 [Ischnura elegans]
MVTSRLLMCLPAIILTIFARPAILTYTLYDIASDRVCTPMGRRGIVVTLTGPLLVKESGRLLGNWTGDHNFSCRWEVEARGRGVGVVAVIQRLRLREQEDCIDHVRFQEYGTSDSTEHICGSMLFGDPTNRDLNFPSPTIPPLLSTTPPTTPPSSGPSHFMNITKWRVLASRGAAIDPEGELKTYIYVANRAFEGDDTLQMVVAYTSFLECDGSSVPSSLFHCGYGLCISRLLVNDGVINCPFGNCLDEGSCEQAKQLHLTVFPDGGATGGGGVAARIDDQAPPQTTPMARPQSQGSMSTGNQDTFSVQLADLREQFADISQKNTAILKEVAVVVNKMADASLMQAEAERRSAENEKERNELLRELIAMAKKTHCK